MVIILFYFTVIFFHDYFSPLDSMKLLTLGVNHITLTMLVYVYLTKKGWKCFCPRLNPSGVNNVINGFLKNDKLIRSTLMFEIM